jgi:hypothetical protein
MTMSTQVLKCCDTPGDVEGDVGDGGLFRLLIPETGSVAHLRENLAAEGVALDREAPSKLDGTVPDSGEALPGRMRRLTASRHARRSV